jgi:hypothetical protein
VEASRGKGMERQGKHTVSPSCSLIPAEQSENSWEMNATTEDGQYFHLHYFCSAIRGLRPVLVSPIHKFYVNFGGGSMILQTLTITSMPRLGAGSGPSGDWAKGPSCLNFYKCISVLKHLGGADRGDWRGGL